MDALQYLTLALFSFIFFIIFLHKWHSGPRKRLPPSPRQLPILGNLHQLGAFPHRSLQSFSRNYGPLMLLHFGQIPVLVASSSDAASKIMKDQDLIFSNRPKLSIPDRLMYGSRDVAFAPYGDYWRQVRSICVIHLLSNNRVQGFRRIREEETSIMVEKIRTDLSRSSPSVVNLSDVLVSLTNDVVCRAALGRKYGDDGEGRRFHNFLGDFVELLGTFTIGDYIPWLAWINRIDGLDAKVERVARLFDEFLADVLVEHRRKNKQEGTLEDEYDQDFVDILLEIQRENKEGPLVEDDTIKAVITDMFAAGTDTTVSVLEWTMAELIRNPRTLIKLQNEVRQVGKGKQDITEDELEKTPYLKAVIKESLRLHSPIPLLIPRVSTQDTKVMGYDIAAGTHVMINAWAIGRDPELWESPEEFQPERFLESGTDFRGLHHELIPFGGGRRGCPGIAFAMATNELALAKLVHMFDFSLPDGVEGKDLDMSESVGVAVHKKLPLFLLTSHAL